MTESSASRRIRITEVGPRDGLQNESTVVPTETKIRLVDALSAAGFPEIETSSFVHPRWVPQLADAAEVFAGIDRRDGVLYSALVPNLQGLERAVEAGVSKASVFTAASESFCRKNINADIEESVERFRPVVSAAMEMGLPVRGYVSCIVECPYEGAVTPAAVGEVVARLLDLGPMEIDLGETLGVASPDQIAAVLEACAMRMPLSEICLHLHDTHGHALDSVECAVGLGVSRFDSACGGLGGCPYAPGAAGNLATERLLALCEQRGWETGADQAMVSTATSIVRSTLAGDGSSTTDSGSTDTD